MKRAWKTYVVACTVVAASLASAPDATAAVISIVPTDDTFTLEVRIADVANLAGYSFSVAFDPDILAVESVEDEVGTVFEGSGESPFFPKMTEIDNTAGTVKLIRALLLQPVDGFSGSGLLASLTFNAVAQGTSLVTPYLDLAGGVDQIYDINTQTIETAFFAGEVTVRGTPPVPEPASVLTLALGLGTAIVRRRQMPLSVRAWRAAPWHPASADRQPRRGRRGIA